MKRLSRRSFLKASALAVPGALMAATVAAAAPPEEASSGHEPVSHVYGSQNQSYYELGNWRIGLPANGINVSDALYSLRDPYYVLSLLNLSDCLSIEGYTKEMDSFQWLTLNSGSSSMWTTLTAPLDAIIQTFDGSGVQGHMGIDTWAKRSKELIPGDIVNVTKPSGIKTYIGVAPVNGNTAYGPTPVGIYVQGTNLCLILGHGDLPKGQSFDSLARDYANAPQGTLVPVLRINGHGYKAGPVTLGDNSVIQSYSPLFSGMTVYYGDKTEVLQKELIEVHLHAELLDYTGARPRFNPKFVHQGNGHLLADKLRAAGYEVEWIGGNKAPVVPASPTTVATPAPAVPAQPTAAPTAVPIVYQVFDKQTQGNMSLGVNDLEYSIACLLFSMSSGIPAGGYTDTRGKRIQPALYDKDDLYTLVREAMNRQIIYVGNDTEKTPVNSSTPMPGADKQLFYDANGIQALVNTAKTYNSQRLPFVVLNGSGARDLIFNGVSYNFEIDSFQVTSPAGSNASVPSENIRYCVMNYKNNNNTTPVCGAQIKLLGTRQGVPALSAVSKYIWDYCTSSDNITMVENNRRNTPSGSTVYFFHHEIKDHV